MFRIERTSLPQVGQEVYFLCRLSDGSEIEKDTCEFEGPSGQTFFTRPKTNVVKKQTERERERERDRQTDKQRAKQRDVCERQRDQEKVTCEFEGPSGQTYFTNPRRRDREERQRGETERRDREERQRGETERERQTERQKEIHRDTDRQTDRETKRRTDCEFEGPSGQTLFSRPNTEMVDNFIENEIKDRERETQNEREKEKTQTERRQRETEREKEKKIKKVNLQL